MDEIKLDTPIEVTKQQHLLITTNFAGFVAHQEKEGKLFIKVWSKIIIPHVKYILEKY